MASNEKLGTEKIGKLLFRFFPTLRHLFADFFSL